MEQTVYKWLGIAGRMISGSKTAYTVSYPKNLAIWNSNILIKENDKYHKIWWGDLDFTKDQDKLTNLCQELKTNVYILPEKAASEIGGTEDEPNISETLIIISLNNQIEFSGKYKDKIVLNEENKFILNI